LLRGTWPKTECISSVAFGAARAKGEGLGASGLAPAPRATVEALGAVPFALTREDEYGLFSGQGEQVNRE